MKTTDFVKTLALLGISIGTMSLILKYKDRVKYSEGLQALDESRSDLARIKNFVYPVNPKRALDEAIELQGKVSYIQRHYGIPSEEADSIVGTDLIRFLKALRSELEEE